MYKRKLKAGDLIKVPFKEYAHTYARILIEGSCAFYDCYSTTEREDHETIIKSDILFVTHVFIGTINHGKWRILTNIPLDGELKTFYPRYFNPVPQNQENVNFYKVNKIEIEQAIAKDWIKTGRMQLDGVPERIHIETRLKDYYEGKTHDGNKAIIWVFKKYLGLTSLSFDDFLKS